MGKVVGIDFERQKLLKLIGKLADFSDETLNLDLPLCRDPDYQKKYIAVLEECQDQAAKVYEMSPEENESRKQSMREEVISTLSNPVKGTEAHWRVIVTKNAANNSRKFLEELRVKEGDFDCSEVKMTRTVAVPHEQRMYGKKVRRKGTGQRQIAVEVKSHGLLSKECTYENFLDTKKRFIILSGAAGSGKTVIMRELAFEFYELKELFVGDITDFKLMVRYECRNETVTNFTQLVESNFPGVCKHLSSAFVIGVVCQLDVFYLVDGYDEVNPVSQRVLNDLLQRVWENRNINRSKILFSTRPQAVQTLTDFLKSNKITDSEIDLLGILC